MIRFDLAQWPVLKSCLSDYPIIWSRYLYLAGLDKLLKSRLIYLSGSNITKWRMDRLIICLGQIWRTEVKTFYIWAEIKCNKNGRVMSVFKHLNQINGTEELAAPQLGHVPYRGIFSCQPEKFFPPPLLWNSSLFCGFFAVFKQRVFYHSFLFFLLFPPFLFLFTSPLSNSSLFFTLDKNPQKIPELT